MVRGVWWRSLLAIFVLCVASRTGDWSVEALVFSRLASTLTRRRTSRSPVALQSTATAVQTQVLERPSVTLSDVFVEANRTTQANKIRYKHSAEIRACISAANKGRRPWNAGKSHSEETKRKIAASTAAGIARRLEAEAAKLGISIESLRELKSRRRNAELSLRPGSTEAKRKRRSAVMKKAWKNPVYRARFLARSRVVNPETRARISQRLKAFWAQQKAPHKAPESSLESNQKRSERMREKWKDPVFRTRMLATFFDRRRDEWRKVLSRATILKWRKPQFHTNILSSGRGRDCSKALPPLPLEVEVFSPIPESISPVSFASAPEGVEISTQSDQTDCGRSPSGDDAAGLEQVAAIAHELWTESSLPSFASTVPPPDASTPRSYRPLCSLDSALEAVRRAQRVGGSVALHGDELKLQSIDGEEAGGELDEEDELNRQEEEAGDEYIVWQDGDDIRIYSLEEFAQLDAAGTFAK